jgi:hypothetical protein
MLYRKIAWWRLCGGKAVPAPSLFSSIRTIALRAELDGVIMASNGLEFGLEGALIGEFYLEDGFVVICRGFWRKGPSEHGVLMVNSW